MANCMVRKSAFGRRSNAAASAISPSLTSVAHKWDDHTFYVPPKVPSTSALELTTDRKSVVSSSDSH